MLAGMALIRFCAAVPFKNEASALCVGRAGANGPLLILYVDEGAGRKRLVRMRKIGFPPLATSSVRYRQRQYSRRNTYRIATAQLVFTTVWMRRAKSSFGGGGRGAGGLKTALAA